MQRSSSLDPKNQDAFLPIPPPLALPPAPSLVYDSSPAPWNPQCARQCTLPTYPAPHAIQRAPFESLGYPNNGAMALGIGGAPKQNRIDARLSLTYEEMPAYELRTSANHLLCAAVGGKTRGEYCIRDYVSD